MSHASHWREEAEKADQRLAATRAALKILRDAVSPYVVHEEYDYPTEVPVQVGWVCQICRGTWGMREKIRHEGHCPMVDPPHAGRGG